MPKLPDDFNTAYDYVKDTLDAAVGECVSALNEERKKDFPDQSVIDEYNNKLDKIYDHEMNLTMRNSEQMQEIFDEYVSFVRKMRGL